MPLTKIQFQDACSYLTLVGSLTGTGPLFIDGNAQIVLDEGNANADITPDEATITQALTDLGSKQVSDVQVEAIRSGAKNEIRAIPNYATWTTSQADTWLESNVTDLASAKVALRAIAKMIIAMRNELYPDLQD